MRPKRPDPKPTLWHKALRAACAGMSQSDVAERLGVSQQTAGRYLLWHATPCGRALTNAQVHLDISATLLLRPWRAAPQPPPPRQRSSPASASAARRAA